MRRLPILLIVALLSPAVQLVGAQSGATPSDAADWQGWAFARLGLASTSPRSVVSVFTSGGSLWLAGNVGVVVSRGPGIGLVRLGAGSEWIGRGVSERAVLAGVRTRGDHFFLTAAAGVADVKPTLSSDGAGSSVGSGSEALAYDLSGHSAYRLAGLELALAGVAGGSRRSYVALTLGVDIGWLGR